MILLYLLMYTVLGFFLFFITACYILIFCIFLKRQTVQLIVTIHSALITVPTPVPASAGPLTAQIFAWKAVSVTKAGSQMEMRVCLWETADVSIMANT